MASLHSSSPSPARWWFQSKHKRGRSLRSWPKDTHHMQFRNAISTLFSDSGPTTLNLRSGSIENPSVPLASPAAFNMIFGGGEPTASGESVSEANALTISPVYACVRLIAESVAGIPLKVYAKQDSGRQEASNHSLAYLLSTSPNADMTAHTFFENLFSCKPS